MKQHPAVRPAAAIASACLISIAASLAAAADPMKVSRAGGDQYVEITDDGKTVLRYNFRTVPVPKGVGGQYAVARGDYIHPLYGPAGEVLTEDYSPDHPHHRGLYWAWPEVAYRGEVRDLHALQGVFARPDKILRAEGGPESATISAASKWLWGDAEPIVSEVATIRAMKVAGARRIIDLGFTFTALVDGVTVARRGQNAYGGFNLRFSERQDRKILTHTDPPGAAPRRAWAQIIGTPPGGKDPVGIDIIQHAGNPDYPGDWVAYPELNWLQPTFPAKGAKYPLTKDKPLVLRYRLWIGGGAADEKAISQLWTDFQRVGAGVP